MNSNEREKKPRIYVCAAKEREEEKEMQNARTQYKKRLEENYKLFKEKLRLNNVIVSEIMYTWHYSSGIFRLRLYCLAASVVVWIPFRQFFLFDVGYNLDAITCDVIPRTITICSFKFHLFSFLFSVCVLIFLFCLRVLFFSFLISHWLPKIWNVSFMCGIDQKWMRRRIITQKKTNRKPWE